MITFDDGEAEVFNAILAEYTARFEPRDHVEHDLVEEIVHAKWQMRQAWMYENSMLGLQMVQDSEAVDREWRELGEQDRPALAFSATLAANKTIANLQRYTRSLALQVERAIKLLIELKSHRLPPAPDEPAAETTERNEPNPTSEHPAPSAPPAEPRPTAIYDYALAPAAPRIRALQTTAAPRVAAASA